jgi:hypothetical protein
VVRGQEGGVGGCDIALQQWRLAGLRRVLHSPQLRRTDLPLVHACIEIHHHAVSAGRHRCLAALNTLVRLLVSMIAAGTHP